MCSIQYCKYICIIIVGDKLLTLAELDPIGLHLSASCNDQAIHHNRSISSYSPSTHGDIVVQVALISESSR